MKHGGGDRCEGQCCSFLSTPECAKHKHPSAEHWICTHAARQLVNDLLQANKIEEAKRLRKYFGFTKDLVVRAEHVFYYELVKLCPDLIKTRRVLDESVLSKLLGKTKSLSDPRPDYFHYWEPTNLALHGEFDETAEHEDCEERLRVIAHHAGCARERVYVWRVCGYMNDPTKALLRRVEIRKAGSVYYVLTPRGKEVLGRVARHVNLCLQRLLAGQLPTESQCKVYF